MNVVVWSPEAWAAVAEMRSRYGSALCMHSDEHVYAMYCAIIAAGHSFQTVQQIYTYPVHGPAAYHDGGKSGKKGYPHA